MNDHVLSDSNDDSEIETGLLKTGAVAGVAELFKPAHVESHPVMRF